MDLLPALTRKKDISRYIPSSYTVIHAYFFGLCYADKRKNFLYNPDLRYALIQPPIMRFRRLQFGIVD